MQGDHSEKRYHVLGRKHTDDAGKRSAVKVACCVWRGAFGTGQQCTSPDAYPTHCPIYYWGDLDAHGFQILSLLRETFPHVISVMMDEETLHTFSDFCVEGTPCPAQRLAHLTAEEHALFQYLARENIRLARLCTF
jgi:hypothetical protein